MQKKKFQLRPGIAMIELIFALVIMGIALMSAPELIRRSNAASYVSFQQESIAAAATQIDMIMTAEWDAADTNGTIGEPVLLTGSPILNPCAGGVPAPPGVTSSSGRYCLGLGGPRITYSATPPGSLGPEGTEGTYLDDIDDYNGQSYTVSIYHNESITTSRGDYIDTNITVTSNIYYGNDIPSNTAGSPGNYQQTTTFSNPFSSIVSSFSTNIKLITVRLTTSNPAVELQNKNIRLSSFMCNIGAPKQLLTNKSTLN
jgi:type II secretory pathway pseudopilin PulG